MEINNSVNIPMPAMPDATREPPRDALAPNAVRESQATEPERNDGRSGSADGDRDRDDAAPRDSSLGNYVDETV